MHRQGIAPKRYSSFQQSKISTNSAAIAGKTSSRNLEEPFSSHVQNPKSLPLLIRPAPPFQCWKHENVSTWVFPTGVFPSYPWRVSWLGMDGFFSVALYDNTCEINTPLTPTTCCEAQWKIRSFVTCHQALHFCLRAQQQESCMHSFRHKFTWHTHVLLLDSPPRALAVGEWLCCPQLKLPHLLSRAAT